jgi:uncharacterized protein (TIGR02996 family)
VTRRAAADPAPLLDQAVAADHAGDRPRALERLILAWRACPAPALKRAVLELDPIPAEAPALTTEAWLAAARSASVPARSALLAAIRTKLLDETRERVRACLAWGPDPRCARAVEGFLRDVPFTSNSSRPLWAAIFELLAAQQDPDFVLRRDEIVAGWTIRAAQRAWMIEQLDAALARVPTPAPALSAEETARLATLARPTASARPRPSRRDDGPALLEAIWADPTADAPRLVYGDWLLERGDPRGELISLQFKTDWTPADARREAALLKQHGAAWLGALAPALKTGCAFRRGFPAEAEIKCKNRLEIDRVRALPDWATFERLTWKSLWNPVRDFFFLLPQMRALRSAGGLALSWLLEEDGPLALEEIWLGKSPFEPAAWAELGARGRLPRLQSLTSWATLDELRAVRSWRTVRRLMLERGGSLRAEPKLIASLLRLADEIPLDAVALRDYSHRTWFGELWIERGADGRMSRVKVTDEGLDMLAELPRRSCTELEVIGKLRPSQRVDKQALLAAQRRRLIG